MSLPPYDAPSLADFAMRDSLRPMLSACELLCFLAVWALGLTAMWSADAQTNGRAGANVAASDGSAPYGTPRTRPDLD